MIKQLISCLVLVSFSQTLCFAQSKAQPDQNRTIGLTQRVDWTASKVYGTPEPPPAYMVERIYPDLSFAGPVALVRTPSSPRLFVVERFAAIRSFLPSEGVSSSELFVDLKKDIPGAVNSYGLAFHPDFEQNRFVYICYTMGRNKEDGTRLSRFSVTREDPPKVIVESEVSLMTWLSGGHNGGCLEFGPDGYLYVTAGDGGPASPPDPNMTGQDNSDLLSTIMRIDVDKPEGERAYSIPRDNPFVKREGTRPEIWAYGFRNPWKITFDPRNGDLWCGDVGWELWEYVFRVQKGGNYGWSVMEGHQLIHDDRPRAPDTILPPTVDHSHREARSVTGGYIYMGDRIPELTGAYIYGDYVTGKIWGLRHDGEKITWHKELADASIALVSFGVDANNELILVDIEGGLYRLAPNADRTYNKNFPKRLSETGLFENVASQSVAPGVLPYEINTHAWEDDAKSQRYFALPPDGSFDVSNQKQWNGPLDTVFAKTISREMQRGDPASARRLETQLLHFDGEKWNGYSYRWNAEQTDAELVPAEGSSLELTIQDDAAPGGKHLLNYRFVSRSECTACHTTFHPWMSLLSFSPQQLSLEREFDGVVDNQLRSFENMGVFNKKLKWNNHSMVDPHDSSQSLQDRARSYLHANCQHCHRNGGGGATTVDLEFTANLEQRDLIDFKPTQGHFKMDDARVIASGRPWHSTLLFRTSKLGRGRMPQRGSEIVDTEGIRLLRDWIASLPVSESTAVESTAENAVDALIGTNGHADTAQLVSKALSTTSSALNAFHRVNDGVLQGAARQQLIAAAKDHADLLVRELFESHVPYEQRIKRLGDQFDPLELVKAKGSSVAGREVFFTLPGLQCKNCHTVQGQGGNIGPDLTLTAKEADKAKLLETLMHPSKEINKDFASYIVQTTEGQTVTGLLIDESDQAVTLKEASGDLKTIKRDDIEEMGKSAISLMPDRLLNDLTRQQAVDLLTFLESLK